MPGNDSLFLMLRRDVTAVDLTGVCASDKLLEYLIIRLEAREDELCEGRHNRLSRLVQSWGREVASQSACSLGTKPRQPVLDGVQW